MKHIAYLKDIVYKIHLKKKSRHALEEKQEPNRQNVFLFLRTADAPWLWLIMGERTGILLQLTFMFQMILKWKQIGFPYPGINSSRAKNARNSKLQCLQRSYL